MASMGSDELLRPEVELRSRLYGNEGTFTPGQLSITSLDLLEVFSDGKTESKASMDSADFVRYCETNDFAKSEGPAIRIFFVDHTYVVPSPAQHECIYGTYTSSRLSTIQEEKPDKTAALMHKHFGVPMAFFVQQDEWLTASTPGNVTYLRRDEAGKPYALDGHYRFSSCCARPGYVWFSQSIQPMTRASCYIICKVSDVMKRTILNCAESHWRRLLVPFAIDGFLMNDNIAQLVVHTNSALMSLRNMESNVQYPIYGAAPGYAQNPVALLRDTVLMYNHLDGVRDVLRLALRSLERIKEVGYPSSTAHELESIEDSFRLLKSKTDWVARQVSTIEDRAKYVRWAEDSLPQGPQVIAAPEHEPSIYSSTAASSVNSDSSSKPGLWKRLLSKYISQILGLRSGQDNMCGRPMGSGPGVIHFKEGRDSTSTI